MVGIRIDALDPELYPSRDHLIPVMKDGLTVHLTVGQVLDLLVGAAPGQLDTLEELAAAINDDEDFAATVTALIGGNTTLANEKLAKSQNLADLVSVVAARTNLGLSYATDALKRTFLTNLGAIFGQARLVKDSTNLRLNPYKGSLVTDGNGSVLSVPSAGVTLAPTGLTADTTYYVYAWDNDADGVIDSMEASATAHVLATNGVRHKTGAAGRVLVGMARPTAGPVWVDGSGQRFVRSWLNDPGVVTKASFSLDRAFTNTSLAEVNSEIRNGALLWAGERWLLTLRGGLQHNAVSIATFWGIAVDSTSTLDEQQFMAAPGSSYMTNGSVSRIVDGLSEGYHYATLVARVNSGTATWESTSGRNTFLSGDIR